MKLFRDLHEFSKLLLIFSISNSLGKRWWWSLLHNLGFVLNSIISVVIYVIEVVVLEVVRF